MRYKLTMAHVDPVAALVLSLAVMLAAAKLCGELAVRVGQPAVLGELVAGIVLGNLTLLGVDAVEPIKSDETVEMIARLGALILLFEVGLESTVAQMLSVGLSALLVATLGVVAPFAFGWAVSVWLLPDHGVYVHAFIGATLTATSVGITARVLQDLARSQSREARLILGAAVIDDVLGLLILAVVTGAIHAADGGGDSSPGEIALVLAKACGFLLVALVLGVRYSHRLFALASRLRVRGVLLATALCFCFLLSWLAALVGLAAIVGAFAAGLLLEETHYSDFQNRGEYRLEELVHPISALLVPVFFVFMGMRAQLAAFANLEVIGLGVALTIAAIAGKQLCALGAPRGFDRLSVGLGMVPRGEVGLIFAGIGQTLSVGGERIVDDGPYSALIMMVIATTMVTPPALRWSLERSRRVTTPAAP